MILSTYLAQGRVDSAFFLFNTFIGFALGPLGALFALGVFGKKVGRNAGLPALVFGVISVFTVYFLNQAGLIDLMPLLYAFIGFTSTFIAGLVLGLFMPSKPSEIANSTIFSSKK